MDRVAELEAKVDALTKELDETKQLTVNLYRLFSENPAKVEQKVMAFFEKYAVKNGPISCLCCGKEVSDPTVWHAELPGIVICTACKSATYKVDALMREKEELREEMVRFRDGLRWYADGHHYDLYGWEDCSGESSNWIFPPLDVTEACWMVDDGGVAQSILNLGHSINPNHTEDDEITLAPAIRALVSEQNKQENSNG